MISEEVIIELIRKELEKGENEFMELLGKIQEGEITQEEFRERCALLQGFGKWWGSESRYSLGKVEIDSVMESVTEVEKHYEISAICEMHYESSHTYWEDDGSFSYASEPKKAIVKLKVSDTFEVENFEFEWV